MKVTRGLVLLFLAVSCTLAFSGGQQKKEEVQAVHLTFWSAHGGKSGEILTGLVDDFNLAHPNIKVETQYMGNYTQIVQKLMAGIAANMVPNLVILGQRHGIPQIFDSGLLLSISEGVQKYGGFETSDYIEAFVHQYSYKGQLTTVPWGSSTPVMYYNKDLFRAAGLDPDAPPDNWDQVVKYGMMLDKLPDAYALNITGTMPWFFYALLMQNGGELLSDSWEPLFNTNKGVEALQYWSDLIHKHKLMPPLLHKEGFVDFTSGKLAMLYRSIVGGAEAEEIIADKFDWGLAFMPGRLVKAVPIGGSSMGLFRNKQETKERASWTFITWMNDPVIHAKWSIRTGYVPVTYAEAQKEVIKEFINKSPRYQVAVDQTLNYVRSGGVSPVDGEMWDGLEKAIENVEHRPMSDPKALLDEVAAAVSNAGKNYPK